VANQRSKTLSDLEVRVVFEPTRISKQLMELAYEALLPIQRRQLQSAISQVDQSQLKPEQTTRNKKEVA
jgi:hypothetical protein